jgi:hypothetical protein
MADDDRLGQNIDKIAYGIAGLIGLVVLAIPFLFGGQIRDAECSAEVDALKDRIERQPEAVREALDKASAEPPLKEILVKQWTVGPSTMEGPAWVTELQPVLIRRIPQKPAEVPTHEAGKVTEVACERDAAKKVPYLVVKGVIGEGSQHVVVRKAALLRKEGEGDFAPVPDFTAAKGPFEFKDYAVEPGKTYAYRIQTTAARDPAAPKEVKPLDPKEAEKASEPLGPTPPVPYDFHAVIVTFEPPDPQNPNPVPRFFGKLKYWDYKAGKAVDWKGGQSIFFAEKEKFAGDRFEFFQVLTSELKVVVRDLENQVKMEITQKTSREPREVTCWAPVVPAAPAPEGAAGEPGAPPEDEPEPKATAKGKAAAPKAPADKSKEKSKEKAKEKPKAKAGDDKKKPKRFK